MARTRIDTKALEEAVDQVRVQRGLSWRQTAAEMGVSPSLLSRLRGGFKPDAEGFMTLVSWLGVPAERFLINDDTPRRRPELMAELAPMLRSRSDLNESDIEMIQDVIQATLRRAMTRNDDVE